MSRLPDHAGRQLFATPRQRGDQRSAAGLETYALWRSARARGWTPAKEAVVRLFALAQALTNDYERFEALVGKGERSG